MAFSSDDGFCQLGNFDEVWLPEFDLSHDQNAVRDVRSNAALNGPCSPPCSDGSTYPCDEIVDDNCWPLMRWRLSDLPRVLLAITRLKALQDPTFQGLRVGSVLAEFPNHDASYA